MWRQPSLERIRHNRGKDFDHAPRDTGRAVLASYMALMLEIDKNQYSCVALRYSMDLKVDQMMRTLVLWVGLVILLLAAPATAQNQNLTSRGELLLRTNCSSCHATGSRDQSRHATAPPFRTLATRYPIEKLAEGLAEGLSSGHPDIPDFVFEVGDVNAILS